MARKKINLTSIQATSVKLNTRFSTNHLASQAQEWIQDESKDTLIASHTSMVSCAENMGEAVKSLNDYLDAVADAFEKMDKKLGASIGTGLKMATSSKNKGATKKQKAIKKKLP